MKWIWTLSAAWLSGAVMAADVAEAAQVLLPQVEEKTITYVGADGWLYSKNELEHLAAGELSGGRIKEVAKATKKENADPIPAIVDFNAQLNALGIALIVVPVPPKLAVYPTGDWKPGDAAEYLTGLEAELTAAGVEVLDLMPLLLADAEHGMYCKTDSHWTPAAMEIAARKLAERIGLEGHADLTATRQEIRFVGDLAKSLANNASESEQVLARVITGTVFDESSPVLLLGDSHTLVFSAGQDMLAEGAGLGEQLAYELQMPVDRIAVKGSASTPVRVNLYRKAAKDPAWLKNKKFVIWVFTCREFTESTNGWATVPVLKR